MTDRPDVSEFGSVDPAPRGPPGHVVVVARDVQVPAACEGHDVEDHEREDEHPGDHHRRVPHVVRLQEVPATKPR